MRIPASLAMAAAMAFSAAAQSAPEIIIPERPMIPRDGRIAVPVPLPDISGTQRQRALGCVKHQLYNTQSADHYSVSFMITTSEGDRNFNFERDRIRHVPSGAPLPLPTRAETLKWEMVIGTLEAAAAARRPVIIDYTTPSNEVFGIYVQWSDSCPN
jgi:hypothetical protein